MQELLDDWLLTVCMSEIEEKLIQVFKQWMNEYGPIPGKVACIHSFSLDERADLRQEMLVQLWRSVAGFKNQCKESTWIYRICLNTALTWKRDAGRRVKRTKWNEAHSRQIETLDGQGTGATEDRIEALYAAIRKLAPIDRNLIQLSLDGLSYVEMADVTGIKESTIGSRLSRARQQLAELIKEN